MDETAVASVTGAAEVFRCRLAGLVARDLRPEMIGLDVRNLGPERCVIMFIKVNPKVLRGQ